MREKREPKKKRRRERRDIPESARRLRELYLQELEPRVAADEKIASSEIPDSAKLLRELAERG